MDSTGKEEEEEIVLVLQQHPSHDHPLQLLQSTNDSSSIATSCRLCHQKISTTSEAYTCKERCETDFYYHRLCVEAPPRIDLHPLHPPHPLPLVHDRGNFRCDSCGEQFNSGGSSFRCHDCNFDLDISCALSMLSSEQITLPIHHHPLTSFKDMIGDKYCYFCWGRVEGDGYRCLQTSCGFIIHKGCIQDLYYADGTKAPCVYHVHPLVIFEGEGTGSRRCAKCRSDKSGEFIGCESCQVFFHRNCFQVPEVIRYPSHDPDHTLVLFVDIGTKLPCESCSMSLEDEIYYRCILCDFSVHVECGLQVVAYCEDGMSAKLELSWHKHPLTLCHRTETGWDDCDYCGDQSIGPMYVCKGNECVFLLHKCCTETESMIAHPHHPDHLLTLRERVIDYDNSTNHCCKACGEITGVLMFSCECCLVDIHVKCAARFPNQKHYLHEHELLSLGMYRSFECNRCGTSNHSSLFRCVACNFNLHEECMELPQVIKNDKIHWHPLTLHETFVEDDTGEYYCEHCEKTRDPRLGAYVCGYCKISLPRIYHIHCVLPELGKLYEKKRSSSAIQQLNERIADKEEEVQGIEEKLKEARQELDELRKQRIKLLDEDS